MLLFLATIFNLVIFSLICLSTDRPLFKPVMRITILATYIRFFYYLQYGPNSDISVMYRTVDNFTATMQLFVIMLLFVGFIIKRSRR